MSDPAQNTPIMTSQEIRAKMTEPERKRIKRQRTKILAQLQQRHNQILENNTPLPPPTHKHERMPTNDDWLDCLQWQYDAWVRGHENPAKTKKYHNWYSTFFPAEEFTDLTAKWYINKMRGFKDLNFTGKKPQLNENGEFVATKNGPAPDQVGSRVVPNAVAPSTDPSIVKIADDFFKALISSIGDPTITNSIQQAATNHNVLFTADGVKRTVKYAAKIKQSKKRRTEKSKHIDDENYSSKKSKDYADTDEDISLTVKPEPEDSESAPVKKQVTPVQTQSVMKQER